MHPYINILQTYMDALGRSDYELIKGLFAADGKVNSPFLGEMPSGAFFDRLEGASTENTITPIDIFLSTTEKHHATAYFKYDWLVHDGTLISFNVMDLFSFKPDTDQIAHLDLIYDTHPIRTTAGNKYEE